MRGKSKGINVEQVFRPAKIGRPKGLHYILMNLGKYHVAQVFRPAKIGKPKGLHYTLMNIGRPKGLHYILMNFTFREK